MQGHPWSGGADPSSPSGHWGGRVEAPGPLPSWGCPGPKSPQELVPREAVPAEGKGPPQAEGAAGVGGGHCQVDMGALGRDRFKVTQLTAELGVTSA